MLTLMQYLPYALVAAMIAVLLLVFFGVSGRKPDYRRVARERHYQWNDNSAHRD